MLRGGVFGFGGVGKMMTEQLNIKGWHGEDSKIVAVANRGKPNRDIAEQTYGLAAYDNVDDLIAHGLDFMLIVSTSHAHRDAAVKCAEAGIPYLLEKPITLTLEDAKDIHEATEKAGVINAVNYTMRYKPIYRKMKDMVAAGELGDVLSVWARSFRGHGLYSQGWRHRAIDEPEESGGWIIHHMCHVVDFAIWVGGPIDEVYTLTQSTVPAEKDSEEIIYSTIKFTNGAIGTLADSAACLRDHSAGVIGTLGGVSESLDGHYPLIKYSKESDKNEYRPPHLIDPLESYEFQDGLKHFMECLREGKHTDVPVSEAYYSLKVCFAMKESAKTGKPVKIDNS